MNPIHSEALLASLRNAPLLAGDLAGAASLDRSLLGSPARGVRLNTSQKLGHLYEDALRVLLDGSDRLRLLGDHVQVFDADGITLGEMDYVLEDVRLKRFVQLELAVKFYLGLQTVGGWQFPGPDPNDNWLSKLKRMQTHQFTLADRAEARVLLRERWGIERIEVRQLVYGRIFYPMDSQERPLPEGIRADCGKGGWLYARDWSRHFGQMAEVRFVPKHLWPIELSAELRATLPLIAIAAMRKSAEKRCVLFTLPDAAEPIFLVPDFWPRVH